jgi:hypothetical protein
VVGHFNPHPQKVKRRLSRKKLDAILTRTSLGTIHRIIEEDVGCRSRKKGVSLKQIDQHKIKRKLFGISVVRVRLRRLTDLLHSSSSSRSTRFYLSFTVVITDV